MKIAKIAKATFGADLVRWLTTRFSRPFGFDNTVRAIDHQFAHPPLLPNRIYVVRECDWINGEWLVELQGREGHRYRAERFQYVGRI